MKLDEVKLNADQARYWMNSKTSFQWNAPGWSHLLVTMMNPNNNDAIVYWSRDVERCATDGRIVIANPDYFFSLKLKQRVAALGHEVAHAVLTDVEMAFRLEQVGTITIGPGKTLPYVDQIAEIAQDLRINAMLKESKIGELADDWYYSDKYTGDMSFVDIYADIYNDCKGDPNRLPAMFPGQRGLDQHLPPGTSAQMPPDQAVQHREQSKQAWKNAIAQAASIARELGVGGDSDAQQKFFEKMLKPKVTWQDEITAEFSRMPGSGGYDWMKFDEELLIRNIFAPARSGYGCNRVCIFMDSSGSIYAVPHLIDRFFAETGGIFTDVKPREIIVIWCDSVVRATYRITDENDLNDCYVDGAQGGGGTDFRPPFEWIEEQGIEDIDMAIYLTDGDGTFPSEPPPYPVLWGDISHYKEKYPKWARVIEIPNDGTA